MHIIQHTLARDVGCLLYLFFQHQNMRSNPECTISLKQLHCNTVNVSLKQHYKIRGRRYLRSYNIGEAVYCSL